MVSVIETYIYDYEDLPGFILNVQHHQFQSLDVTDADVTAILNQLATADSNGAQTGDVVVAYQNQASTHTFDHDNAPNPYVLHIFFAK